MKRFGMLVGMAVLVGCAMMSLPYAAAQGLGEMPSGDAGAEQPPVLEDYIYTGQAEQYARVGWEFVRSHPQSNFSPGVVSNILMLGELANNQGLTTEMRRVLLFNYPRSVHAQHLIKTYPSDEAFRKVLKADMQKDFLTRPEGFPQRYVQLLRVAIKQRGSKVLNDDALLLTSAVAAHVAGDEELAAGMVNANRQRELEGTLRDVRAVALNDTLTAGDKLQAIMPYLGNETARQVARLLLLSLTDEQRLQPDVLRPTVAVVLFDRRFEDAIKLLNEIAAEDRTDRDLFWLGWAYSATGQTEQATAMFDAMAERFPDSQWTTTGAKIKEYLADQDQRLQQYGEVISNVAESFQGGAMSLEITGSADRPGPGGAYQLYIGAQTNRHFELQLRRDDQLLLAYRDTVDSAALYNRDRNEIIQFDQGGLLPEITLALMGNPSTGFTLQTGFRVGDDADLQKPYLAELVTSPYLSNAEGVMDQMRYQRSRGRLTMPVIEQDGAMVLGWAAPGILEPTMTLSTMTVADGRLTELKVGGLVLDHIAYSHMPDMKLNPQAWPDLATVEQPQLPLATVLQMYGDFVRMLVDDVPVKP